ncbi:MAG: porin [Flavobacteriales bacterium]|nr:porin [Flavobacteriales bacterium]
MLGSVRRLIANIVLGAPSCLLAQEAEMDSSFAERVEFSAFVDVYYAYDLGHPTDDERPAFLYQYDRHNEVDLNLGLVRADITDKNLRAALSLMAGTYAQANLINEPELLRNVQEARVGVKLARKHDLWLDAGIFCSHIGMESAIAVDNWALTRSIIAENTPYYLSGAKLTWTPTSKVQFVGLLMNGWQRIRRVQNATPCFGTQVLFTPRKGIQFNWSTFFGSDTPDSLGLYRVFNNFWFSHEREKWGYRIGADIGVQEDKGSGWNSWVGALALVRRKLSAHHAVVARAEYYADPDQVVVATGTPHGLGALGYSLGAETEVRPGAVLRFEARTFHGVDPVFSSTHGPVRDNTSFTVSMAARF